MAKAIIGGKEVGSERVAEVRNPASGELIDVVPILDREVVREAIEEAHAAQLRLEAMGASARQAALADVAEALRKRADEIAKITALEIGRPIKSSRADAVRAASIFELAASETRNVLEGKFVPLELYDYPAGNANRVAVVQRQPVGVVASITPFNFPAASFAHKVAPALAVGNSVVHKPSVSAPLTQLKIASVLLEEGLPAGSINVVTGESGMIGDEFLSNPKVSLITFTGSESVGLELASKAVLAGKRVIMELGGSDAEIVFSDADMDAAAQAAIVGRFDYAGQFCNATKRLLVEKRAKDSFLESLLKRFRALKVGDPLHEDTDVGPLINYEAVKKMEDFLRDAEERGGSVVERLPVPASGFYFPPVILEGVSTEAKVMKEEVFGPILPIAYFESEDEAVEVANSTKYGLDASVFTVDLKRAYRVAKKLRAGTVVINDTTRLRWDNLPFGGVKRSGIGRESVRDTMAEMTEPKLMVFKG
ncbi:MAG: aldehyde dehydrogenase family protein [Thermoprotei archaeon]